MKQKYSMIIQWSNEDNSYIVRIPEFPGLSAFGKTRIKAIKQAEICLNDVINCMIADNEKLPEIEYLEY